MQTLNGKTSFLRPLEKKDLEFLMRMENDPEFWVYSGTQQPYSREVLEDYLGHAQESLEEAGQYRFVICNTDEVPVGLIDLYGYEPVHRRVGIGILVAPEHQGKGFGSEALELLISHAFKELNIHSVHAQVLSGNEISERLFKGRGFQLVGTRKDWIRYGDTFFDELLYQLLKNKHEH